MVLRHLLTFGGELHEPTPTGGLLPFPEFVEESDLVGVELAGLGLLVEPGAAPGAPGRESS